MPSFSDVVQDKKDLRMTIEKIEETKKRIRRKEKEHNPDMEFALRANEIVVGPSEFGKATSMLDEKSEDNILDLEVVMLTFFRAIESGYLNPYN